MELHFDKLIELPGFIESFHSKDFKMTDVVHNDVYRHMNDAGLFDYKHIDKGFSVPINKPSTTNLVFLTWLMIVMDLKSFGVTKNKLHKVKDYLFEDFDIVSNLVLDIDKQSLIDRLEKYTFSGNENKNEIIRKISSGEFFNKIKGQTVSRMFLYLFKIISTGRDIQLYVDGSGEAMFIDELELTENELEQLSYDSKIVLPLKKYITYFIGDYAPVEFLTRSKILNETEAEIIRQFRRDDIVSLTIKYHEGRPNTYEVKKLCKPDLQARLSQVLLKRGFEDIIIKTKQGSIYYSELVTKTKL